MVGNRAHRVADVVVLARGCPAVGDAVHGLVGEHRVEQPLFGDCVHLAAVGELLPCCCDVLGLFQVSEARRNASCSLITSAVISYSLIRPS